MTRVRGTAIYLVARRETAPSALVDSLRHNRVLHDRIVLLTVTTDREPYVPQTERMAIKALDKRFSEMSLRFGLADAPDLPAALEAHRAEFPTDTEAASFCFGCEMPAPTMHPKLPMWREKLCAFMIRNAVGASDYFRILPKRVFELGTQVEFMRPCA